MLSRFSLVLCLVVLAALAHTAAQAHVVCGNRVFPTTLTIDDPGVSNELSLPTIAFAPTPSGENNVYAYEWDKLITEDLGFAVNGNYATQRGAQSLSGWDNLTLTLKDQHPCVERYEHEELVWSVGIVRLIPGTGSTQLRNAGAIASVGATAPTIYIGKGLGALRVDYLRPLAITAEFSRQFSDTPSVSPSAWTYAASLQYSMPYLQQHIKALKVPQFVTRLTPIAEFAMSSPAGSSPTGTIAPGLLYEAKTWQLSAEAVLPATATTRLSQGTGFIIQYHVFLDAFYKSWFGKPLVKKNLWGS